MEPALDLPILVNQAKIGDLRAVHTLYCTYAPSIRRYCYQRLNNHGQAEQCVQAIFVEAWQNISAFEYRSESLFVAWFYTIANNILSHQQHRNVVPALRQSRRPHQRGSAVSNRSSRTQHVMLAEALNFLSVEQQHVITLKFFAGLSNRDIATAINRTEGAVKTIQHHAIHQLHQLTM